jgi:hypothetical protein
MVTEIERGESNSLVVETYKNHLAGGADTKRWWAHEKILVGGSIQAADDWKHLKAFYGCGGVLSVEAERHDGSKQIDGPYVHLPAPDDGLPKPAEWWAAGIVFMAGYFEQAGRGPIYIHSQSGLGRAPAMAYACMRAVFGMGKQDSLNLIRLTLPTYGDSAAHKVYLASAEATMSLLARTFAPEEKSITVEKSVSNSLPVGR